MTAQELLTLLTDGTTLVGPHWTEPVKVLTAKARGPRIEMQAGGLNTKRLWTKLLNPKNFSSTIKVMQAGQLAALNGNPTHFRLAAEAHRIRLAFQYNPPVAVAPDGCFLRPPAHPGDDPLSDRGRSMRGQDHHGRADHQAGEYFLQVFTPEPPQSVTPY